MLHRWQVVKIFCILLLVIPIIFITSARLGNYLDCEVFGFDCSGVHTGQVEL
jgi:hypothetical protein